MNRQFILDAVEQAATARGYSFHSDSDVGLKLPRSAYPAVWLNPPQFVSKQGRTHGKVTYSLTMHLMGGGVKFNAAQRAQAWEQMEDDALEIFSIVSQGDKVVAVNGLKVRSGDIALASNGEVVTTATAEVVTFY